MDLYDFVSVDQSPTPTGVIRFDLRAFAVFDRKPGELWLEDAGFAPFIRHSDPFNCMGGVRPTSRHPTLSSAGLCFGCSSYPHNFPLRPNSYLTPMFPAMASDPILGKSTFKRASQPKEWKIVALRDCPTNSSSAILLPVPPVTGPATSFKTRNLTPNANALSSCF